MKCPVVVALATSLYALPLCAQTIYFSGQIGDAPVFAALTNANGHLNGWYLYTKYKKEIELEGRIDAKGAFHLDEADFDTLKKSGRFDGTRAQSVWRGTWRNAGGANPLAFALTENHDRLAGLSGDFRCAEKHRDKQFGYVYTRSAHLRLAKGAVTRMDLSQDSTSADGDTQSCSIGLEDFKQVPDGAGILLRAKADDPGDTSDGAQHCTVRIVGNRSFLFVGTGDMAETGNDCKGAGGEIMFCAPRASWGDFVIDKSGICGPAE